MVAIASRQKCGTFLPWAQEKKEIQPSRVLVGRKRSAGGCAKKGKCVKTAIAAKGLWGQDAKCRVADFGCQALIAELHERGAKLAKYTK